MLPTSTPPPQVTAPTLDNPVDRFSLLVREVVRTTGVAFASSSAVIWPATILDLRSGVGGRGRLFHLASGWRNDGCDGDGGMTNSEWHRITVLFVSHVEYQVPDLLLVLLAVPPPLKHGLLDGPGAKAVGCGWRLLRRRTRQVGVALDRAMPGSSICSKFLRTWSPKTAA